MTNGCDFSLLSAACAMYRRIRWYRFNPVPNTQLNNARPLSARNAANATMSGF
jgi:hypothetical protein